MSDTATAVRPKPAVPFLKIPEAGEPYLEGFRCSACKAVQMSHTLACPACGARDTMHAEKLANTGKLYNYTVVYRNFPGVKVPFVSVIVDLDGGGTVKGNLVDIEPDPKNLSFDMPVRTVYRDAGTGRDGSPYLAYFFVPA